MYACASYTPFPPSFLIRNSSSLRLGLWSSLSGTVSTLLASCLSAYVLPVEGCCCWSDGFLTSTARQSPAFPTIIFPTGHVRVRVCVCECVCECVCVCVCAWGKRVRMVAHINMQTHVHTYAHTHTCTCKYIHAYINTRTYRAAAAPLGPSSHRCASADAPRR